MPQRTTVLTRKGQITIPVEIRRALALEEGDQLAVILEDGQARLVPSGRGSVVTRTAGALKSDRPRLSAEEERDAFERAVAEEVCGSTGP